MANILWRLLEDWTYWMGEVIQEVLGTLFRLPDWSPFRD